VIDGNRQIVPFDASRASATVSTLELDGAA
jgi:hypothetical protein